MGSFRHRYAARKMAPCRADWLVAAALACYAVGCGWNSGESSDRSQVVEAFGAYLEALREGDAEGACKKTFLSTDLPEPLGEQLGFPTTGPHRPTDWKKHFEECVRGFDARGGQAVPRLKRVVRVTTGGPSADADGISASAQVRAVTVESSPDSAPDSSFRRTTTWVKFEGDWKLVGDVG